MGKPKHSDDPRGEQKGAQVHAEGQHGERTRSRIREQINAEGAQDETQSQRAAGDPNRKSRGEESRTVHERYLENQELARDGRHRLMEGRHQHDEAERKSDKNRLTIDVNAHKHDKERFQVPGGRETHPALPPDDNDETIKAPRSGGK